MFGLEIVKRKTKETIEAVITAEAFDGFFNSYAAANKDLSLVPVYACLKIISQTIAISPIVLYEKTEKGRKEKVDDKLTKLMKKPYKLTTYFNWMQTISLSLAGRGNAYALIVRDINYEVTELIPLLWDNVYIVELINSDDYFYHINHNGKMLRVWSEDILHFKVFSEDGKTGLNPIEVHRRTLDSASGELDYSESFYKQAANVSGVIEYEKRLDKTAMDAIKEGFVQKYGGVKNAGKTAIVPDGGKYKQLKLLSPMDANYIETAKLTRADIGVIFGVPLPMLGDLSQATFGNMSELYRAFHKFTISPYYVCIASELDTKLLLERDKEKSYFEYNSDKLLAVGKKERYEYYASGIRNGHITRNEVRELENLETIDGLDEMLQESGVMTVSQANQNFNTNGGDIEDKKKEVNIEALAKNFNDFKSQFGRMERQLKDSLVVTPNKKDGNE